ncbi:MAG: hypothetical protein DI598_02090 [Pseudopedobacter saltans]|uniref:Protein SirB1 N-terminal domain-containing protein n=1 Tax=Pseudopedobacter saltans TaxID=151895 RepID=A0A2W5F772_9SPHI|nr:MAG: hypothetical protein DI598_02090 [Pseudopedobacter saltans]
MLAFNNKIQALLSLMDDTDIEVYSIVTDEICQYGKSIIPHLEHLWENTLENQLQERIELLIHQIQYNGLENEFVNWTKGDQGLLDGVILVARYQYPELDVEQFSDNILKLWKTVWLELNDNLTSLEQLHILNSILYHFYKLEGTAYNYEQEDFFLLNKVLEKRKGNALSNGILYQIIAEQIGLPIKAVHVPNHYLLAFFQKKQSTVWSSDKQEEKPTKKILFFIDATTGNVYNKKDMLSYLEDNKCLFGDKLFTSMENTEIIAYLLKELSSCFDELKSDYKKQELARLVKIVSQKY